MQQIDAELLDEGCVGLGDVTGGDEGDEALEEHDLPLERRAVIRVREHVERVLRGQLRRVMRRGPATG